MIYAFLLCELPYEESFGTLVVLYAIFPLYPLHFLRT